MNVFVIIILASATNTRARHSWDQYMRDRALRHLKTDENTISSIDNQNESAITSRQTFSGGFRRIQMTINSITRLKTGLLMAIMGLFLIKPLMALRQILLRLMACYNIRLKPGL